MPPPVTKEGPPGRHAPAGGFSATHAQAKAALTGAVIERILRSHRFLLLAKLAAPAAHEIINPVSASLNLAALMQHILKDEGIPQNRVQEFRGHLSEVVSETARAGRIASEMLTFARASSRGFGAADLNEIVRQSCALAAHMIKMADVESHMALADALPRVLCDGVRLQQAVLNLLVNAVEAVEECRIRRIAIQTRLQEDSAAVILEIHDSGEGISPERLPRIFEPFFTTKAGEDSLGLGLPIARGIAEECQGLLEVASRPGEGATARMTLPFGDGGKGR